MTLSERMAQEAHIWPLPSRTPDLVRSLTQGPGGTLSSVSHIQGPGDGGRDQPRGHDLAQQREGDGNQRFPVQPAQGAIQRVQRSSRPGRGDPPPSDSDGSGDEGRDAINRALNREIREALNTSRPGPILGMNETQLQLAKLLRSLAYELDLMREHIVLKFEKKNLFSCMQEEKELSQNLIIKGLSEKTVTMFRRTEDESHALMKECTKAILSPEATNSYIRALIDGEVRPLFRIVRRLTCNIATILSARDTFSTRQRQQERVVLEGCSDVLTMQEPSWQGPEKQSYIFYMLRFLQAQTFIADPRARYLRLERAMRDVPRARDVLSYYTHSQDYGRALRELNSIYASARSGWQDAIRVFERLPSRVATVSEQRELHASIRQFRSFLEAFTPLRQYLTDAFIVRVVLYRLSPELQEDLVKNKKKYEKKREWASPHADPRESEVSFCFYILEIWNQNFIAMDREMDCLVQSARQDTVSSVELTRAEVTGARPRSENTKKVNTNVGQVHRHSPERQEQQRSHDDDGRAGRLRRKNSGKTRSKDDHWTFDNYSCRICKKSSCQAGKASPLFCEQIRDARHSEDAELKNWAVDKLIKIEVCPVCGEEGAGNTHHCPPSIRLKKKNGQEKMLDLSKVKCELACKKRQFYLPKYLCPCCRPKPVPEWMGKRMNINVARVIRLDDPRPATSISNETHVVWEDIISVTGVSGVQLNVCLTLDTEADENITDTASFNK